MQNFRDYLEESLNTPVEFYMTEDTKLPDEIYGAFNYDGTDYGMALVRSTNKKIFMLKFYQVVNGKPRHWKFKSKSHIRPCFSTLLKFVEASLPFVGPQMQGVLLEISKKLASERFNAFGQLMVNRLYNKTFKSIPVSVDKGNIQVKKEYYHYLFFAKKNVNAKSVFNNKAYAHYTFINDGEIPLEMAVDTKEKKKEKVNVSLEHSKKYSFKNFEVKLADVTDPDYFKTLEDKSKPVKEDAKKDPKADKAKVTQADVEKTQEEEVKDIVKGMKGDIKPIIALVLNQGMSMSSLHGFNQDKVNFKDIEYVIGSKTSSDPILREILAELGIISPGGGVNLTGLGKTAITDALKAAGEMTKEQIDSAAAKFGLKAVAAKEKVKQIQAQVEEDKVMSVNIETQISSIDPAALPIDMPGAGTSYIDKDTGWRKEKDEDVTVKANHIMYDMDYHNLVHEQLSATQVSKMKSYSGSSYDQYNNPLRDLGGIHFDDKDPDSFFAGNPIQTVTKDKDIKSLADAFGVIKPLPKPMWVYRGARILKGADEILVPGNDYIEPAFMSTSIKSLNSFGMHNLRLAIYLPAGAQVLPILNHSHHTSEREILLPPMSVLKIIQVRTNKTQSGATYNVDAMFVGSAWDSVLEKTKELALSEGNIILDEANKKYDVNKKFGGTANPKFSKAMSKLIKSNKLKVSKISKKPEQKDG